MLIILFNLIIILAFATRVMLMMIQRTNEPENERKRRQVDVYVEKADDDLL